MSVPLWCDGGMNTTTSAPANENHHIWNNNGTYWCHFTVHPPDFTKRRVRMSLHTADIEEARRQRDLLLRAVPNIACRIPRTPPPARPAKRKTELHTAQRAMVWSEVAA